MDYCTMRYTGALISFILLNSINSNVSFKIVSENRKNLDNEPKIGDFFPDWVPFKNKNSAELFDLVPVPKPKPKKRLALPLNFFLKAVADSESSDDYYEKNQGDSGDDYEKSDWSDLHRDVVPLTEITKVNHTDLIDIDGIPPHNVSEIKPYVNINIMTEKSDIEIITEKPDRKRLNSRANEKKHRSLEPYKNVEPYKEVKRAKKKLYEEFDYEDKSSEIIKMVDKNDEVKALNEFTKLDEIKVKHSPSYRLQSARDTERANEDERLKEELETELFLAQQLYGKNDENTPNVVIPYDRSNNNKYDEHGDILVGKYESDVFNPPNMHAKAQNSDKKTAATAESSTKIIKLMYKESTTTRKTVESIFQNPALYLEESNESDNETSTTTTTEESDKPLKKSSDITNRTTTEKPESTSENNESTFENHESSENDEFKEKEEERKLTITEKPENHESSENDEVKEKVEEIKITTLEKPESTSENHESTSENHESTSENHESSEYDEEKEKQEERKRIVFEEVEKLKREHEAEQRAIRNRERKLRNSNRKNYGIITTTHAPVIDRPNRIRFISPEDNANAEPILFFPKRNKKKRKPTTPRTIKFEAADNSIFGLTSNDTIPSASDTKPSASDTKPANANTGTGLSAYSSPSGSELYETNPSSPDVSTSSAETSQPKESSVSKSDATSSESLENTGPSAASVLSSPSAESAPSAPSSPDAVVLQTNAEVDTVPAATDQKKEDGNHEHEKGGGKEYYSSDEEEHGEHGKKAYEGRHEDTKVAKGKHDKEDHLGKYEDKGGYDKHHHDESGHYGVHQHKEKGKKHAKYEESGKHSKGHSTKGSHDIHKKEEYEKNVEFFEEEGDSGEEEKHGGYKKEDGSKSGGKFHKGDHAAGGFAHESGNSGHHFKGHHAEFNKGHKQSGGYDGHGKVEKGLHNSEGAAHGKKWVYHHGHPAKTANLVLIDRGDYFQRGPVHFRRF